VALPIIESMTLPFPSVAGPAVTPAPSAPTPTTLEILAHRGAWTRPAERNTLEAFDRAFANGWGVEIDVRDLDGELVVSHDPPARGALRFADVVDAYRAAGAPGRLAVNVKADGLQISLRSALAELDPSGWFTFDMSVPDAITSLRHGLPVFTRHSDIEPEPVLYRAAEGVWLDDFGGGWLTEGLVTAHLDAGKRVAVVSPELHGRDHQRTWSTWREWTVWRRPGVSLCTDFPQEALEVLR
jgi:glycerophosphoryl diester phosphodiesterase